MIIKNYRLKWFLRKPEKLISEYIVALQYVKPLKTNKSIYHLKLKDVEFIKKNLYSNNDSNLIEIVKIAQGFYSWDFLGLRIRKPYLFGSRKILKIRIIKFFGLIASIKEQIERISNAERVRLTPEEVNPKWDIVNGSQEMAIFGIYNTLEALAGGDLLKYKKIMNINYSEIFTVLSMRTKSYDLNRRMEKIKTN